MKRQGRVLGLDLGARRIGIAVADSDQRLATPAGVLERSGDRRQDHLALGRLAGEHEAVGLVVGLPVGLSGGLGPAARAVLEEVEEIRSAVGLAVETADERLTTAAAASALRRAGLRSRAARAVVDETAAAMLLQTWLDRRAAPAAHRP